MALLDMALGQAKAWYISQALASDSEAERKRAMYALRELGAASLASLHAAVRRDGAPRVQFGAAVVLHWLGDPTGLSVLIDGLKWQLPANPKLARELEAAFILIGAPDAVDALMRVWKQTLPTKDNRRVRKSICRVWANLRDSRPLAILSETALEHADLFEEHVPAFGETALNMLSDMAKHPQPARRSLAVRTLRHIAMTCSAHLLMPLLCDPEASVRVLIPQSLEALMQQRVISEEQVQNALLNALEAGYSTSQAVTLLLRKNPMPCDALLRLVARWNGAEATSGDTLESVLTALPALAHIPLYSASARGELQIQLCTALERCHEPQLVAALARALAERGHVLDSTDAHARTVLLALLPHLEAEVRQEAANALAVLGDEIGRQLQGHLEVCWPQPNLRDKVQALLRGGTDATHVANQAMQWFTRFSKEAVERWNTPANLPSHDKYTSADPRLPEILCRLLTAALDAAVRPANRELTAYQGELSVACIRALLRLQAAQTPLAHKQIVRALALRAPAPTLQTGERPVGNEATAQNGTEVIRIAAGQALLTLHGPDSFPLFAQTLHASCLPARLTAIAFLAELGDVRALSLLQSLTMQNDAVLAAAAQNGIARIRHHNPETMQLLRASAAGEGQTETLLRPAYDSSDPSAADVLLRPIEQPAK